MTNDQRIPITVIGGYLGAGKTTLVNHILRSTDERIAVIVNDFGEISIDEDLIAAADSDKLTLANGCICCSLAEGFAAALSTVRTAGVPPARLLIEASGVADPNQIAAYGHTPGLALDAVVVLADAEQVRRQANDRWVADTVRIQLAAADLVVVNKIDLLAAPEDADALCDWLAAIASDATLVRVNRAAVPMDVIFGPELREHAAGRSPSTVASSARAAHDTAEDVFESQTVELDAPVPMPVIEALLADLPDGVARLKGLVPVSASSGDVAIYVVQAVGTRTSIDRQPADSAASTSRWAISVIAHKGTLPPDWLRSRLQPDC
ncbi:MAG: GTP-binding protein [Acidimicrobiales bacterium]|nr:GTP-binding protein [Acidimicrobiales bacterium]MYG31210.1 GTP-binding protein [Holophagales bacterium]MYA25736.1 GTP-binding protein [Acidimicrobiales bacterium]MYD82798.1 GTP-binding protein [Acidimicrobiales bacterium]MYG89143.1 GTP-binding protein [Acidimicrobiales bacterium]